LRQKAEEEEGCAKLEERSGVEKDWESEELVEERERPSTELLDAVGTEARRKSWKGDLSEETFAEEAAGDERNEEDSADEDSFEDRILAGSRYTCDEL
jgi:hypothetical protein